MNQTIGPFATFGGLVRVAEFRAVFLAHLFSILGDAVGSVALAVLVYKRTGSAALSAIVFSSAFLPHLFGGVLASVLAYRIGPRRLLVVCNLLSAVLLVLMVSPAAPVPLLLLLIFVVNLLGSIFLAVRASMLPNILHEQSLHILGRSVMRAAAQSGQVVGFALGSVLLTLMTPQTALLADAASFGISAVLVRFGTVDRQPLDGAADELGSPLPRRLFANLRRVLGVPELRRLLLFSWLVSACVIAPEALAVPYLREIGEPETQAGYLLTAIAAGAFSGDLIAARLLNAAGRKRIVRSSALLACLSLLVFAHTQALYAAVPVLFISGFGFAYIPGWDQYLTELAATRDLSIALAVAASGVMATQGFGFVMWGVIAEFTSVGTVVSLGAVGGIAAVLAFAPRNRAAS